MVHQFLFMVTSAVAIATYLGLATYVVTRSPHRSINWVFGGFCLTIAGYYLSSLFRFANAQPPSVTPLSLRWLWFAASLSPAFYLHLVSFYFLASWWRFRMWLLGPVYLVSAGFALAALFTDLFVAGPLYRPPPLLIGPVPGPLMYFFAVFFALIVAGGTVGLLVSYQTTRSVSLRRQILYLLTPIILIIVGTVVAWSIVLTNDTGQIPRELVDLLLIPAAFFFANAVLRYGSFVGHPSIRRDLFYLALVATFGLAAFYLTTTLDHHLSAYTPFPYPITTGILIIVVAASIPFGGRWLINWFDKLFFQSERKQRILVHDLTESLFQSSDSERLQAELLRILCQTLDVHGGYVALVEPESPTKMLEVRIVWEKIGVKQGDRIHQPSLHRSEPHLVDMLSPYEKRDFDWGDVALFCPLTTTSRLEGILALGEKRNGKRFTAQDLTLCAELTRHLNATGRMMWLREQRNHYLEAARLHDLALRRLEEKVITSAQHTFTNWEHTQPDGDTPVAIQILGPLVVLQDWQPVPEAAWETEKAKTLLAFLLWKNPDGATREEISTVLWPQREPVEAANIFHVTLHHLRRVLEPKRERARNSQYIILERGHYRFNSSAPHWLDVTAFETLVKSDELTALNEAISLYRGPYLQDMSWALPPEVETERRRLEAMYLNALRHLAAQIKGNEAATYLEKLLAIEPADETAQHALVLNYLSRGRRDLAQRQVQNWRHALAELDLKPSLETMALWQMVEITDGTC